MKYTLENYKTGEIKIIDLPQSILNCTIKESVIKIGSHDIGLGCTHTETLFCLIFGEENWQVYKLPFNKSRYIMRYILPGFENLGIDLDSLYGVGCPDFLLINLNKKKFKFVEVKHTEKALNKNQKDWIKKFKYEVEIAKLAKIQDGYRDYTDEEIIEMNRIIKD